MDKQTAEPKPKKQEETLSFCGVAISVKYAEQDNPHITETLKRSVFSYGFYNNRLQNLIKYLKCAIIIL